MKLLFSACAEILLFNKITIPLLCSAPRQGGSCRTNLLLFCVTLILCQWIEAQSPKLQ